MGVIGDPVSFAMRGEANEAIIGGPGFPGALPPPPGVEPNLVNPSGSGRRMANVAVLVLCDIVVTILFGLRVYVKLGVTKRLFLEDVTCVISWACVLLYSAFIFIMMHNGEGYHTWDISPVHYSEMLKWLYASSILYCPAAYFTKITLLLMIARVFVVKTGVARGLHIFLVALFIAYLPIQILKTIICSPISAYWDIKMHGHCMNQRKTFVSDVSLAVLSDLIILVVPIPLVWRLRMSLARKLKIMALLCAGGIAIGLTAFRLYKLIQFLDSNDVAADFVVLDILTILELAIGVCCACLPAANIFIESSKANKQSGRAPHAPEFNTWGSQLEGKATKFKWRGLGTTCHRSESEISETVVDSRTTGNFDLEHEGYHKGFATDFDAELAALSGNLGYASNGESVQKKGAEDTWFDGARANSDDGRREGWLDASSTTKSRISSGVDNTHSSTRSNNISDELARIRLNQPCDRIWDGPIAQKDQV